MAFEPVPVHDIELKGFKNSPGAAIYKEAKALLRQSGIINFLRTFARPYALDGGTNIYAAAHRASFCEGYNKALDDLMYFDEMYLSEAPGKKEIKATFGGLGIAVAKGDLKEEDIKNVRNK